MTNSLLTKMYRAVLSHDLAEYLMKVPGNKSAAALLFAVVHSSTTESVILNVSTCSTSQLPALHDKKCSQYLASSPNLVLPFGPDVWVHGEFGTWV